MIDLMKLASGKSPLVIRKVFPDRTPMTVYYDGA
jgi:hypothetical protein